MKEKKKIWTKWLYWFTFAVAVIIVYKTLDNFSEIGDWLSNFFNILTPFILGIIISYILYIPTKKIEKLFSKIKILKKKSRLLSVILIYIIVLFILVLVINYILPIVSSSILDIVNNFTNYYNVIVEELNSLPEDSLLKNEIIIQNIQKIGEIDLSQYINVEKITKYAQGAISIATGIFNFFVSLIVSAYILLERTEIVKFARKLFGAIFEKDTCKKIGMYFNRTNDIFLKFLASQLLDAIVVGILTSIAMNILGVKYAILLGIMIGLFNMIPYFGAIIAVVIATIITFITGGVTQAIWLVFIITILQQIDANIINPKIVGESLKISPLLVIFAVTIGGAFFNILGMFLAVPVAAVLKVFITDYIEMKSRLKNNDVANITKS